MIPLTNILFLDIETVSQYPSFNDLPESWKRSVAMLGELHARWRLLKLSFPVALPELFTSALDLQTSTRENVPKDLTEALRGLDN